MTLGEQVVKEVIGRGLSKDPLSYEEMQKIKKLDDLEEIKTLLQNLKFKNYEDAETVSDLCDVIINPKCKRLTIKSFIISAVTVFFCAYFFGTTGF